MTRSRPRPSPEGDPFDEVPFTAVPLETAGWPGLPDRRRRLLGLDVDDLTLEEAALRVVELARERRRAWVAFVNAHCFNVARRDASYLEALRGASLVLPDGVGVRLAARLFRPGLRDNPNGTDLFPHLCRFARERGLSMALVGGQAGVAEATAGRSRAAWPGLEIVATLPGEFSADGTRRILETLRHRSPDLLLVAGGVPLQEQWIASHLAEIPAGVTLAVGGLFDFYSGRLPRAPRVVRRCGLEWSWRLLHEPRRLAARYLLGNPAFLGWIARVRLHLASALPEAEPMLPPPPVSSPRSVPSGSPRATGDGPAPPNARSPRNPA